MRGILKIKNKNIFLVGFIIGIVILAYSVREYTLKNLIADFDEPFYTNLSLDYANLIREKDIKGIASYYKNYEHPSLVKILYGFVLTSQEPIEKLYKKDLDMLKPISVDGRAFMFSVRRTSAIFGTLTVFFTSLFNPIAGLFLGINTTAVHYTSIYYFESMATFFASMSVFSYLKWKKERIFSDNNKRIVVKEDIWLLFSSAALGLTAASKYIYAIVGVIIIVDYFIDLLKCRRLLIPKLFHLSIWGIGSIMIFFVFNPMIWINPIDKVIESIMFHFDYSKSDDVTKYDYPFWQPFVWLLGPQERYKTAIPIRLDVLILFFSALGLPSLYRKWRPMFIWLIVGLLFLLIWDTKWPQYIMLITTPLCFSAGEAVNNFIVNPIFQRYSKRKTNTT